MLYAATTFWLLVIVFAAYGVYQLWAGLVRPRVINIVLLPGTLVAQLGRIIGLLVTGGTVNDTTLIKDDETGEPAAGPEVRSRIPVVGPILVALLPMLACGLSIYAVVAAVGQDVLTAVGGSSAATCLPTTLHSFWELLRSSIGLVEQVTAAVLESDFSRWQSWLFVYLIVCLTVRMAPLPGAQRGAVGAILLLGVIAGLVGLMSARASEAVLRIWDLVSFSAAVLLFLLMATLVIRGAVGLVKILAKRS